METPIKSDPHITMAESMPSDTSGHEPAQKAATEAPDYFVKRDGQVFAGIHLIIDLEGASRLDEPAFIEDTLIEAAKRAGATVLNNDFHIFSPNDGVSGVVILAESHISIHTWPERGFAALDVFMCGECDPMKTIPVLKDAFNPERVGLQEIKRGLQLDT